MRLEDFVAEWVERGDQDIGAAFFLMGMRPLPLEVIGFHCQQAVEKYLKAFLVLKGVEPEKTHDLAILIEKCSAFDASFSEAALHCSSLTDYAAKTRYPSAITLDVGTVETALDIAQKAIDFIKGKFPRR